MMFILEQIFSLNLFKKSIENRYLSNLYLSVYIKVIWDHLKTFPFFTSLRSLFFPLSSSLRSVLPHCSLFPMNWYLNIILSSCRQKKVMFLLRRIPFSTHHSPARNKLCLPKLSAGLTWLWLVVTSYRGFFSNSCMSYFVFPNILNKTYHIYSLLYIF